MVRPRFVVTTLDESRRIPLVRYSTMDWAMFLSEEHVRATISQIGFDPTSVPSSRLLAFFGRGQRIVLGDTPIYPEQVKECLYRMPEVTAHLTGNFRMKSDAGALQLRLQMKRSTSIEPAVGKSFEVFLSKALRATCRVIFCEFDQIGAPDELWNGRKYSYLES